MSDNNKNNQIKHHGVLVIITDPSANISYASEDFCQLFGYSREELYGRNISFIGHPKMPKGPFKQLWETILQGQPWMGIILNSTRAGKEMWLDTYIIPSIENGKITEYQCIYREPSVATVQRAQDVYEQRRLGKMPKALIRKQFELGDRLNLSLLLSLIPSLGWMLWQMPTYSSLTAASLTLALAVIGNKRITRRFKKLVDRSRQIVSHPVKQLLYTGTADDIGQLELVQCMLLSQLDAILRRVQNASSEVEQSSYSSSQMTASTVSSINSQQVALEHIAAAVEEMTVTTDEVTNITRSSLVQVQQAQQDAELGTKAVDNAINAIKSLNVAIDKIGQTLETLQEHSSQIDKVVDVIHEIADKTNLLALNAAIEAARAGEDGRGFAVVADEVRTLAQQTRISTTEISAIIEELHTATANTSNEMKGAQVLAGSTVERIEETSVNLLSIIEAINAINNMSSTITTANEQQNTATREVNEQIHAISNAATDASDQAQKTLELSNNTTRMAQQQNNMVEIIIANN
ncbi:MAG: methyl-accepting chemotaxis protein [Colwellia sp.]|nr:methyl-accepting chemotaxis protein [Colwellia sp.]MCW8865034.1 methyl-accepting chemotaxis protein [Colwellia sp.]MCW9080474.1 methyl-accepting chemotaxis protein [Colwellia sp.]